LIIRVRVVMITIPFTVSLRVQCVRTRRRRYFKLKIFWKRRAKYTLISSFFIEMLIEIILFSFKLDEVRAR